MDKYQVFTKSLYFCRMNAALQVSEFLNSVDAGRVLLDVRSPGEFQQGHIPGAVSFPLFSDEERAQVGTKYKKFGHEAAFELGLSIIGPKMAGLVKEARQIAPEKRLAVHCWRGGQRSASMAWLLRMAGHDVVTLQGGYKQYRQAVADFFQQPLYAFRVLGGMTGTGKTYILHALAAQGEQVLDLEGLAKHKGSAFGWIGESPQPKSEQFENDCHLVLRGFSTERPVWVENESRSIGKVFIEQGLWNQMKQSPLYNVTVPEKARINNLLRAYVMTDKADLISAFHKIDRKLGGLRLKNALEALEHDNYEAAARIALEYYDKTYQHCLDVNVSPQIHQLEFNHGDIDEIASFLRNF
jgi:tRNA 2-selenouridine synthase